MNILLARISNQFIILIAIVICFTTINGQLLSFKNYTDEDGLPQNTVFVIFQDSKGFIWLGTEAGLIKFDGINFTPYTTRDGLINSTVRSIAEDSSGNLWIGTINGISKFDRHTFQNFNSEKNLSDNYIYSIVVDPENRIWFGSRLGGLFYYQHGKFQVPKSTVVQNSSEVYALALDKTGRLFAGTGNNGVLIFENETLSSLKINNDILNRTVRSLFFDTKDRLWIGTDNGAELFSDNKLNKYINKEEYLKDVQVRGFTEDLEGNIWIASYGNGLIKYDGQKYYSYKNSGMISNNIQTAIRDQRGDLWFGTYLGGVSRLPADYFLIYNSETGLADNIVYAIGEDKNGKMYFGHYGFGISILHQNKYEYLKSNNGLIDDRVSSFCFNSDNSIWIGTSSGISNYSKGKFKNYDLKNQPNESLIVSLLSTTDGNIIAGGNSSVLKYNYRTDDFDLIIGKEQGLKRGLVWDIFEDTDKSLWFATELFGVLKYKNDVITTIGSINDDVNSILKDSKGNYWFALNGSGVVHYDGTSFRNISKAEGLSDDISYGLLESSGKLFISTLRGISVLDLNNFYKTDSILFKYLLKSDGIPSNEFNGGAYFKDSKGSLWLGTQRGLIEYNPSKQVNKYKPNVFLDRIIISDGKIDSLVEIRSGQKFESDFNNITFEFSSPNFFNPQGIQYKFRLTNIEERWITTSERKISYRAIPPGDYLFEIFAANSDGNWSDEKLGFSLIIEPPIYATWWFRVIIFFSLIGGIYAISIFNNRRISTRNLELKRLVDERTKELSDEKDKSESLLLNILPNVLVKELKTTGKVQPRYYENVSILFTDFEDFTSTASLLPADNLVEELNEIFKAFDEIVEKNGLEKLKTSGDSYMAAAGLPQPCDEHALKSVRTAIEMLKFIDERNRTSSIKWAMRIGINSGPVITGVVGTKKFNYDVWGDTVNIASRMESSAESGFINISENTYKLVKHEFKCNYRGKLFAKGKGKMDMYYIAEGN